jgi:hypothetical protein
MNEPARTDANRTRPEDIADAIAAVFAVDGAISTWTYRRDDDTFTAVIDDVYGTRIKLTGLGRLVGLADLT